MSEIIETFLTQMREQHDDEIRAIELPEGTEAYVAACAERGDHETLTFMLKLAYLMGLRAGYAAQREETPERSGGPLQA